MTRFAVTYCSPSSWRFTAVLLTMLWQVRSGFIACERNSDNASVGGKGVHDGLEALR
jgi:hypothetical protein